MKGRMDGSPPNDPTGLVEAMARVMRLREPQGDDLFRQAAAIWGATVLELLDLEPADDRF